MPVIDIETMKNPDTESVKFTRCNSTAGFEDVEVEGETQIQVYDGNPKQQILMTWKTQAMKAQI